MGMSIFKWNGAACNISMLYLEQPENLDKVESSESCLGSGHQGG